MFESNRVKYLFFKYAPLIIGLIIISFLKEIYDKGKSNTPEILLILVFSSLFLLIFFLLKDKYRNICIGRNKITIDENKTETEYGWLDVESINLDRFLGLYHLKLKGRETILFTSYGTVTWLTGDTSEMGQIIEKMKSELDI